MATAQLTTTGVSIRNVLIATDFSQPSNTALRYGLELARRYGAETKIAYVVATDEYLLAGPEVVLAARDTARRDLLELKAKLKNDYSCVEGEDYRAVLMEGPVAECILDYARTHRVDLIVVGTHGRGGIGKMFLGSAAERIFRHSPVPVLTIGPNVQRRRIEARNILLAADFTPAARNAAHYACSLAREHNARLTVVHALQGLPTALSDRERVRLRVEEKLIELIGHDRDQLDVALGVEWGEVAPSVLSTAAKIEADYIVVGVNHELKLLDRLRWPNAYGIVREAQCPVLTVRGNISRL